MQRVVFVQELNSKAANAWRHMTEDQIYAGLVEAGIAFEKLEHMAVFTGDESDAVHRDLPAAHTKNLFLKGKKGNFWLIDLPSDRRADLKEMAETLGAGKFSFAKPAEMEQLLRVTPGSVTPLAACNAPPGTVRVVFYAGFRSSDRIAVHPLRNTATIALAFGDLVAWL
ncbi:prolyl-tRNA synthetase associated domain-containing protein [Sphingosinicella sp. CPCC 101087]|uniref:prolyl-tRNA synthetase associated domain-containing protein n=1 Tax=Sphingosinicella sp. CPCC 101087 TaxID=2497754 RepID=UPI001FB08412|nr:prolyl-tRNA synthetase associated domain-containing protein [Sphingosinicella sp. CPCC 101087]